MNKKWVDPKKQADRDRWVAVCIVFMVIIALLVVWVGGVTWGRMGRDCDFMAQRQSWDSVPAYCKNTHVLHVM